MLFYSQYSAKFTNELFSMLKLQIENISANDIAEMKNKSYCLNAENRIQSYEKITKAITDSQDFSLVITEHSYYFLKNYISKNIFSQFKKNKKIYLSDEDSTQLKAIISYIEKFTDLCSHDDRKNQLYSQIKSKIENLTNDTDNNEEDAEYNSITLTKQEFKLLMSEIIQFYIDQHALISNHNYYKNFDDMKTVLFSYRFKEYYNRDYKSYYC